MNTEQNEERTTEDLMLPGDMLRQAREAQGYSQKDVASRLRLRLSVVNDIEQNNFEQAQLATFTRGYVRSYAKFVGLDELEIVARLDQLGHAQPKEQEMQSFSRRTKREAHDNRIMRLTWVLAALFIGLTGVWWWQSLHMSPEAEVPATLTTQPPLDESLANSGTSPASVVTVSPDANPVEEASVVTTLDTSVEAPVTAVSDPDTEPKAAFTDSFTEPAPVEPVVIDSADSLAAEQVTDVVPEAPVVVATGLELTFSGDCWIDIRDAKGRRLDTGVKKAGDVLKLDGDAPFKIVLGAPGVVTMSYKGKPVDLSRYPAGKVARLKLPQ